MKNLRRIAAIVLCMLFIFPSALAQAAAYRIGHPAKDAFIDAFASGKLVSAGMKLDLDLDAQALGATDEEAQMVDMALDVLRQTELTVGAGLIDEGVRIALGAQMTDAAGENPVGVSALADVTLDGVAVESDVIPGKRMTAKWETILALCGMEQSDIEMIMSVKNIDPAQIEQLMLEAIEEIEPMIEMAAQLAAPYAKTAAEFVMTLPIEVRENLTEEDYPPTAKEINITVTAKDVGALLGLLCDQLDQDATLKILLNTLLAQAEMDVTVEELLAEIRSAAQGMTDTQTPVTFYLGMNEKGVPMYAEVYIYNGSTQESIYGGLFLYQNADGVWTTELLGGAYDAQGNPYGTGYIGGSYQRDPSDPNAYAMRGEIYFCEGETPLVDVVMALTNLKTEGSELPAYDMNLALNVNVADGSDGVQMVCSADAHQEMTTAGGEAVTASSAADVIAGGVTVTMAETVEQLVEPTADGGVSGYTKVSESIPAAGVNQIDLSVVYASEVIDMAASAALEQISLETVTENEMNALMQESLVLLSEQKLPAVMANLPEEALQMIAASTDSE